jgi:hypothetical protein
MQDPPEEIPRFLEQIDRGSDLAAGWRRARRAAWHRRVCTALFNRCVRAVSGVDIHDMNCGMKAYRRRVLETIWLSRGMHRFTAVLAHGNGFRVTELQVPNHDRLSGRTKFGGARYFEAAVGLLGALYVRRPSRTPLMSFGGPGVVVLLLALAGAAAHLLWGPADAGDRLVVLLALTALFLLGMVMLVGGLVGELVMQRLTGAGPLYVLDEPREPRR